MAITYGFNLDAVGKEYTAAQFTEAFYHLGGDAVPSGFGTGFKLALTSLLSFTVGTGYGYVNGHWLKSTGTLTFTLAAANVSTDRHDALALVVDEDARRVTLEVLTDIDPDSPVRDGTIYQYYLYTFNVKRGATYLYSTDVTECRTSLISLDAVGDVVNEVYTFSTSGIEDAISTLLAKAAAAVSTADDNVSALTTLVENNRATYTGDLRDAVSQPSQFWLACDGSTIPAQYTDLIALVGSTTPVISSGDSRLTTWIYAGEVTA